MSEGIRTPELYDFPQAKKKPPLTVRQHPGADINEISNSGFPLGMIKAQLEGKVKMCIKKDFAPPRFPGARRGF